MAAAAVSAVAAWVCPAAAAGATLPPPASGEPAPFAITSSANVHHPSIAVEGNGTAHIAWTAYHAAGGADQLMYCRLPRGATACDVTHSWVEDSGDSTGTDVLVTGNLVQIVDQRLAI